MLGCSTTPVREAINMLRQEKLIVSTAFHCSSVVSFQEEDIKNLMYVRKSLELAGLRQAFERITEEDVKELERIVENYRQAYERIDVEMVSYHNKIFHNLILQRSQNSILLEMIESISDRSDMIPGARWFTIRSGSIPACGRWRSGSMRRCWRQSAGGILPLQSAAWARISTGCAGMF